MKLVWKDVLGQYKGDPCETDEEYAAEGILGRYTLLHYTGRGKIEDCDDGWQLVARIGDEEKEFFLRSREHGEQLARRLDEQDLD